MSKAKSKARKGKESKEVKEAPAQATKQMVRPQGRAPFASVMSRHGTSMVTRRGKGFSFGEIEGASLPLRVMGTWRVPLDSRRRSVLEENVTALRKWYVAPTEGVRQVHEKPAPEVAAPAAAQPPPRRSPKKKKAAKKSKPRKSKKSKK